MKIINDKYYIHTLDNGLRIVCARTPGVVTYTGVLVGVGSRDEAPDCHGLAHFVEHTLFKGTKHRRSRDIARRMEVVGGELNAYTTKEETMIYTNAPQGHVDRSLELISDIIKCSTFPERDINREKEVIIEEIHSYRDSPSEAVFDDFEELTYAGSSLAHNILGTPNSVRSLTGATARKFLDDFYTPDNMVLYCVDSGDPERNIRRAERFFGDMEFRCKPKNHIAPPPLIPFAQIRNEDNHQANTLVGNTLFGRTDPRRHALFLLNNYLGGPCMNSRLNLELRERRGLVYTVESNIGLLSDTGLIQIYFGTDPKSVNRCLRTIQNELDRLAQCNLSERNLNMAREQYCGQLLMSSEHRESRAMALAKSLMYFNEVADINTSTEAIRNVSADDIRQVAELILSKPLSSLTIA